MRHFKFLAGIARVAERSFSDSTVVVNLRVRRCAGFNLAKQARRFLIPEQSDLNPSHGLEQPGARREFSQPDAIRLRRGDGIPVQLLIAALA